MSRSEDLYSQFYIDGMKTQTGEDERSKMFGQCKRCHNAPIRNFAYVYCPECFNEWLVEIGEEPREWENVDGIMVGREGSLQ